MNSLFHKATNSSHAMIMSSKACVMQVTHAILVWW
jgi:hypothetical protein